MKKTENKLDEMQEQRLLHIERNGCWFAFWALLISIFVQMLIFGPGNFKAIAGEWIVFMILAVYLSAACLRNGIWDRRLKPDLKTNLSASLIAAIAAGGILAVINFVSYTEVEAAAVTFVCVAIGVFILTFIALTISAMLYKKRLQDMESRYDEE
ncbi:DUF6773 family protein [Frisingicoccus sp.]|uniref:DUF6773 family protein n=1 Tax=Frisingicoccus sp. TaxID=1918627 RepID=UPI002EA6C292|nr:DUF6773 family protein [Frisingicoccus sp.]